MSCFYLQGTTYFDVSTLEFIALASEHGSEVGIVDVDVLLQSGGDRVV